MQPHRCVVDGEPEFQRYLRQGRPVDDHAPENSRVHGLQLRGLHDDAAAVQTIVSDRYWLEFVDRQNGLPALAKFIEQDVAHHPPEPGLRPYGIAHLVCPLQRPLNGDLEDLLGIDLGTGPSTNDRKEPRALFAHRFVNGPGTSEGSGRKIHRVPSICARSASTTSTRGRASVRGWTRNGAKRVGFAALPDDAAAWCPAEIRTSERSRKDSEPRTSILVHGAQEPHGHGASMQSVVNIEPAASCGCPTACDGSPTETRQKAVRRALRLEYLTVAWNVVEGLIAVGAAVVAGSVAILGFGIDSFVECAAALVMIWRLRAERDNRLSGAYLDRMEHRARRLVSGSLFLLAAYVTFDAVQTLWAGDRPVFSPVGVVLLMVSVAVMLWLARAKLQVARELGSTAMAADAFQTTACWWLSLAALVGVGLNGLLGWWWADPAAALVIALLVIREAREAWNGKACC
jgi:Co/Zn/Cd efflux system component